MSSLRYSNNLLGNIQGQQVLNADIDNGSQQQSQSNSEEDYQLVPRQYPIYGSPRKDTPIECYSKPFVYHRVEKYTNNQIKHQDSINKVDSVEQDSFMLESKSEIKRLTSKKFSSSKKFEEIPMKQVQSQHDIQFPTNQQQKQRQKQLEQQNISFVSVSSQKVSQTSKSNNSEVERNPDFNKQKVNENEKKRTVNIEIETKKIVTFEHKSNPNSNQVQSINSSSDENEMEQVVTKYHFQTQRQFIEQTDSVNENSTHSLNLIKVSPDQKFQNYDQSNVTFSPNEEYFKHQDPYKMYKKSAENSPLIDKKQTFLEKQSSNKSSEISIKNQKQHQNHNSDYQRNYLDQGLKDNDYDHKLIKSMQKIDDLRKQLLKSTQNNIHAIFSSNISAQQCQVAQMVDKINKKVGQVCQKVQEIQRKRIIQMEKQLQRRRILSYQRRQREFQRQEFKLQMQRQRQRQRQIQIQIRMQRQNRRNYEGRSDNMVLDLGRGCANQGKIIAIYPNNKMFNVKGLIFGQEEIQKRNKELNEKDNTLKLMLQMQQTFISTLKTFQSSVDQSLKLKLQEIKKAYKKNQQQKRQQTQRQQKLQRISQQTNDRQNQEYDDSRGSINVMYLRKLRQLEEEIRDKQWKIQRLEKENYYMEKQMKKAKEIGFTKKGRQSRVDVVSPLKNNVYGENVTFNNSSRKVQNENNFSHTPVSPLKTYNQTQDHNINFSFSSKIPQYQYQYQHQNYPSSSSSQQHQQKINEPATMANQQLTYITSQNPHSKKKSTHSFHHYESKNIQSKQILQMKQKLSQFQLMIKQKDLRIKQLENTIMDHLENSRKWKKNIQQQSHSSKSSKISGYSSVSSKQESVQILHIKINNLKTLLKQSKSQAENYKKLYQAQKVSNSAYPTSNQHIKMQNVILGCDDIKSNTNTSRSLCVSDKTTIKNQRHAINGRPSNLPFVQITQIETVGQKSRNISLYAKQPVFDSVINENGAVSIITGVLVNFVMMSWSLKEVITKLCGKQVNVQKINRNARQFLTELKQKNQNIWKKVWLKLDEGEFDSRIRDIWKE